MNETATLRGSLKSVETHTHPLHIHKVDVELGSFRSAHLLSHILKKKIIKSSRSNDNKIHEDRNDSKY